MRCCAGLVAGFCGVFEGWRLQKFFVEVFVEVFVVGFQGLCDTSFLSFHFSLYTFHGYIFDTHFHHIKNNKHFRALLGNT